MKKQLRWSDSDRREPVGPVNGRNHSPTGWSTPCRLSYVSHSSQSFPNLPSFLVFSNFPILLVIFFCLLGPDKAKYAASVRVTFLPTSSSSSRQPQLFPYTEDQLSIHRDRGPASPHSLRRSTPPATSEAEARGASTFQGPPSAPPSAPMNNISLHHSQGQSKAGTCNISLFRNLQDCVTLQF